MRRLSMLLALVVVLVVPAVPAQAAPALPTSIAATGDSITRAFDPSWSCFLVDCPRYSWSTGSSTSVPSHYRRIAAAQPGVTVAAYNDAKTGARMNALDDQMLVAAGQRARYVTVLMGANDLCTSSTSTMTPVDTFRSQFRAALTAYFGAAPADALVFVSSIPNIYQLWYLFRYNLSARSTWQSFGICQSMLALDNTSADRQVVVDRETAFNTVLAQECAQWARCRWDGGATYRFQFQTSHVSTVDYFHPSVSGQTALANVTWTASYWGS